MKRRDVTAKMCAIWLLMYSEGATCGYFSTVSGLLRAFEDAELGNRIAMGVVVEFLARKLKS